MTETYDEEMVANKGEYLSQFVKDEDGYLEARELIAQDEPA